MDRELHMIISSTIRFDSLSLLITHALMKKIAEKLLLPQSYAPDMAGLLKSFVYYENIQLSITVQLS